MIGKTISHYKILERLGEGGMGVVYKAEDTKLKRVVALKFLPSSIMASEAEKTRFVHEAQAAAALNHPNICTIYEIDEANGQQFIAMEFVEGQSLKDKVSSNQLPVNSVIEVAIQIAEGLQAAHEKKITHRDIKPANVMITNKGQAKIMDFGLAKFIEQKTRLTKTGMTIGTVAYMSPEQAQGVDTDHRADIWSFGAMLYEMITGQLPFHAVYEQAVIYRLLHEDPELPKNLRPDIPEALQQIILRALAKDREQRYSSAAELLQDLQPLQAESSSAVAKVIAPQSFLQLVRQPRVWMPALALLLIIAGVSLWPYLRLLQQQRAEDLLPQIERLAKAGRYDDAYLVAAPAEKQLANDTTFARLMADISDSLTIITQPEGARVYLKPFLPDSSGKFPEREYLGNTPIAGNLIPRIDHKVEIEKDGFSTIERLASSVFSREESSSRHIRLEETLREKQRVPEDMAFVPGGDYELVSYGRPTTASVQLDDFFIDKYEVSNRRFKAFIEAGGYLKQEYWKFPFIKDGKKLTWQEATQLFKDRTGLPGPHRWVNQEYPEGKADFPVTDLSWYEAAAYAQFAGKQLPTVFQWEKAAQNGVFTYQQGKVMPWGLVSVHQSTEHRANFSGPSLTAVNSFEFGISPFGCYNMAGNAKEWCLNETTNGYLAAGGSWEDPEYLYGNFAYYDGFFASRSLGFRCVKLAGNSAGGDQGGMKIDLEKRTPTYTPANEAAFKNYLTFYKYDHKPLDARIIETVEAPEWRREKITFAGAEDERVIAYLYLPKKAATPYQCLNYTPHGAAFYGVKLSDLVELELAPHIKSGRAVFAVVPKSCTERETTTLWPRASTVTYRELCVQHATEWSMGLDYLATRDDIDMDKLAYFGMSWGASTNGLISAAVETRYRAVVLVAGAIELFDPVKLPEANPINFVPYIKPPKLLIQGKYDERFPLQTHAKPLFDLFREPKQLIVVDWGHMPPLEARVAAINNFLDNALGAVIFE